MGKKSSSWYKRHVNDEFVKQANKENWRSRAVFKLKEIDTKYDLIKKKSNINTISGRDAVFTAGKSPFFFLLNFDI